MKQRWTKQQTTKLVEQLKTAPRSSGWLLYTYGDARLGLKKVEQAGYHLECGRGSGMHSMGKHFWWIESNRKTLLTKIHEHKITELEMLS